MFRLSVVLSLSLMVLARSEGQTAFAQSDVLAKTLTQYAEVGEFNGSAMVVRDGEILIGEGGGLADFRWGIKNDVDTRFRIGSVTKQFTAAIILQLVEEGALRLDESLSDILPDYPKAQGEAVTLHQLLNHTSGIPSYTGIAGFFETTAYHPLTIDSLARLTAYEPLEFEPGSEFRYNNSGYVILGLIIENKTGATYEEALHTRLLGPLGLDNTGYDNYSAITERMASGYERPLTGFRTAPYLDTSLPHAAGMMYSTVGDLTKWALALADGAPFQRAETLELMWTPGLQNYAYGVGVSEMEVGGAARKVVQHGGGINGFSAFLRLFPDENMVVAVLDNTQANSGAVAHALTLAAFGDDVPRPLASMSRAFVERIEADGFDLARVWYLETKASGGAYRFAEGELNTVGYHYLGIGEIDVAIQVLELNAAEYPEGFNTFDSLAEAMEAAGNVAGAIENYRKSLSLNENNTNARDRLKALGASDKP